MLARRSLELRPEGQGLLQPRIARETLADCGRAQQVIDRAREQAARLLEQASDTAEARVLEAQAHFWAQAGTLLQAWEAQRQAMWEQIETSATRLVNEALHRLLDEVPEPARVAALVRQLAEGQRAPSAATLHCHPDDLPAVVRSLGEQASAPWTPQADAGIARHQVRLHTPGGLYQLDWPSAVHALRVPEPQA